MAKVKLTFYQVITAAINYFAENGYKSQDDVDYWVQQIKQAAEADLVPENVLRRELTTHLVKVYERLVETKNLATYHPGITPYTLQMVKPRLRWLLDQRILNAADLIKDNKTASIGRTLRRFRGWATSIPIGGSDAIDKMEEKAGLRKAMAQLPFEERRVIIDQGHKLAANINNIVAEDGGAIAMIWHSHWRQKNYNYREDHKERDEKMYGIRNCWAHQEGLMKRGANPWLDQITQCGEEVFCRCFGSYVYSL